VLLGSTITKPEDFRDACSGTSEPAAATAANSLWGNGGADPNKVFDPTEKLTELTCQRSPEQVYVLHWIAGRHAGIPEFSPPYTIVA
jgi:hypothetical protein